MLGPTVFGVPVSVRLTSSLILTHTAWVAFTLLRVTAGEEFLVCATPERVWTPRF